MNASTLELATPLAMKPQAAAIGAFRIETITDEGAFRALKDEWGKLLEASRSDSLFLTWEWLHTWWTHLSGGTTLAIVTLRRGAELMAIAPFVSKGMNALGI